MGITVSNVTVVQGTGTYVKESVLEVSYTLAADGSNAAHTFDMKAQIKLSSFHPAWMDAYLYPTSPHPDIAQTGVTPGTHKLLIRVPLTLSQAGITTAQLANWTNELYVQVQAKDTTTTETSTYAQNAAAVNLKAKQPTVTTATMPHYIGGKDAPVAYTRAVAVTLAGSNSETSPGNPSYYRLLRSSEAATTVMLPTPWATSPAFNFSDSDASGPQSLIAQVFDQYYNMASGTITFDGTNPPYLQKEVPTKTKVRLVGSVGSEDYTGIKINADGSFTPDRTCKVYISAESPVAMTFKILSSSHVEPGYIPPGSSVTNIDATLAYNSTNAIQTVKLTTDPTGAINNDYDIDATVTVMVQITDAAGNQVLPQDSIRLNTRIYKTHHKPMEVEDSSGYRHLLYEITPGGNEVPIPRTLPISGTTTRAWGDTFYPASHAYPMDSFGNIIEASAIAMAGKSNSTNDAVALSSDKTAVYYDDKGRPTTVGWTMDGTKNYSSMLSSRVDNMVYWVIDNSQHGDYRLEFEWLDLNANIYGPPFNPQAPYKGDVLVIYDGTATGALTSTDDPATGGKKYTINNSQLLTEIAAYTGTGSNVINLTNGQRVGANSQGGFTTDYIRGVPIIVIVLYSDAAGNASGYKLKSSPPYQQTWSNYDVDETNGELWVHKHSSLGTAPGSADMTVKRLVFNYYDRNVQKDLETGTISFDTAFQPTDVVTADFTYWNVSTSAVPQFVASEDDLVLYEDANVYVLPSGQANLTDAVRGVVYENQPVGSKWGRVTTHITWDKDSGVLKWDDVSYLPPGCRIVAEYTHHSYKRLTRDGYGDLNFADKIIVADDTPAYPDFTYADIKIVNEGDAMLEKGKITFVPRGVDTDGHDGVVLVPGTLPKYKTTGDIVDQVLDLDRPWDVQKGTSDETCDRMACALSASYIWERGCPKSGGSDPNNKSATGILGTWKSGNFPDNLAARSHFFGRVVWVLGGSGGASYPTNVTAGSKRTSVEIEGKYYAGFVT